MTQIEHISSGRPRLKWGPIVERARAIVLAADSPLGLRNVHYRLSTEVDGYEAGGSRGRYVYKRLSELTAAGRRAGTFPDLVDGTRAIDRPWVVESMEEAVDVALRTARYDRLETQPFLVFFGVEKRGTVAQVRGWFVEEGIPIIPTAGYASQSIVDEVRREVEADGRPAVLIYAGDFDPTGEDVERDLVERVGLFERVVRVGITPVQAVGLPRSFDPGDALSVAAKRRDSRYAKFVARHGRVDQVELEAMPVDDLRGLFQEALAPFWDASYFAMIVEGEEADRRATVGRLGGERG